VSAIPSVVERDQDTAVSELRNLRKRAEQSAQEIGQALLRWQRSLGHGKFKRAYLLAGWTENQVYHYLAATKSQQVPALEAKPEVVESMSQLVETNIPPISSAPQVSFPPDSPYQPQPKAETLPPKKLCDLVNDGSLADVCYAFMGLVPYEAMQAVYELTLKQKQGETQSQLEVLWWKIQIDLYKKGE